MCKMSRDELCYTTVDEDDNSWPMQSENVTHLGKQTCQVWDL